MYKIAILIIVGFLLNGCIEEEKKDIEQKSSKVVKVLDISKILKSKNSKEYPAEIYPFRNSDMAFEVAGKIAKFNFEVGDSVKKGDVIASLDDTIYQANFNSASATYEKAKLDYDRYEKLFISKSTSISKLEDMKKRLNVSKSNYQIAKKNLENTKLTADFDGVIAKKHIEDFARITAKQSILVLQDNSKFKVKFFIPENDILEIDKKISLKEMFDAVDFHVFINSDNSDLKYKALFFDISTKAEEVTRTYEATLTIKNPKDKNIFSGMTAKVKATTAEQHNNIFIPLHSIFTDSSNKSFVWLVDKNNEVRKKKIATKTLKGDSIEVTEGLSLNDTIVTSGIYFLKENDTIRLYEKLDN